MKFTHVVPFVALGSAFVYPTEQVFEQLAIEDRRHSGAGWSDKATVAKDNFVADVEQYVEDKTAQIESAWHHVAKSSKSILHDVFEHAGDQLEAVEEQVREKTGSLEDWLMTVGGLDSFEAEHPPHHPPHDRDPHHPPPGHGPPPPHDGPHHGPPHHGPPHHPHDTNLTVYELIAKSNYTTVLAKLINKYPDLVETLNSTKANFTVFAPTDKAFEKIPEKAPKPSKEFLLKILQYHVLPGVYSAPRVLASHTAPTLLVGEHLSGAPQPQRVAFKLSLRGLTVNWFSRIIAVNIFGTNGVIHGVDSLILPPPPAIKIIDLLPGEFSTLELGLVKTGLYDLLNTTDHNGGTLFAPDNVAFERLGPKINAFLFSSYGEKYLKALLQYHVVPDHTLYSDAYYSADGSKDVDEADIPRGRFHIDLPTLLEDRSLSVDVARFGGFITIKINAFTTVAVQDVIAQDGVIHILRSVLIPPKKIGGASEEMDGELTVEELKERLEPFVSKFDL